MKKWLVAAVVASLGAGLGCETPESQQAQTEQAQTEQAQTEQAQTEQAKADKAEADKAEHVEGEQAGKKKGELAEDLGAGETGSYGGEFSVEGEPMTLASALEKANDTQGPVKVTASIEKVCKKKGCWFTLAADDVDEPVRVRMKDYSFFVPRNANGAQAVVEGQLEKRVIPQKEAQHYADDEAAGSDKEPEKVEGDKVQWEMTITAAKISKG